MKKTVACLALGLNIFAGAALAQETTFQLPENAKALRPIKGRVTDVRPLCPEGATCATDGTVVTLEFQFPCGSKIAPITHASLQTADGKLHVYVSANEVVTDRTETVLCIAPVTAQETVVLNMQFGEVVDHYLGFEP